MKRSLPRKTGCLILRISHTLLFIGQRGILLAAHSKARSFLAPLVSPSPRENFPATFAALTSSLKVVGPPRYNVL